MYSPFWHWWRLKRRMRQAARLAIRAGFVALLLLVAWSVVPWVWPGADDEVRRLFTYVAKTVQPVTERAAEWLGIDEEEQMSVQVIEQPSVRVFRGSGPQTQSGLARAIDGDTLEVNGVRIRLHGIDAPEQDQPCRSGRRQWPCGREATRVLANQLRGRQVVCEVRDRDVHGRAVATCRIAGGDLNAWMVAEGWALAYRRYSHAYVVQEARARREGRGLWRSQFVPPWEWREGQRR